MKAKDVFYERFRSFWHNNNRMIEGRYGLGEFKTASESDPCLVISDDPNEAFYGKFWINRLKPYRGKDGL